MSLYKCSVRHVVFTDFYVTAESEKDAESKIKNLMREGASGEFVDEEIAVIIEPVDIH